MSANPTSFRFPFTLPTDIHPGLKAAIKNTFNGLLDANQAIAALSEKVNANTSGVSTVTKTVTQISAGTASTSPAAPVTGNVNLQPNPVGGTSYITQSQDFGGLIVVQSTPAFAITLNSGLGTPYYTIVFNFGTGVVTMTPDVGLVNNGASVRLLQNQFAMVFFDPTRNFWALITVSTVGLPIFANNAAAIAGGLLAGDSYRTNANPDFIAVVH